MEAPLYIWMVKFGITNLFYACYMWCILCSTKSFVYIRMYEHLCVFTSVHIFVVGSVYEFEAPKTHHIPYLLTAETLFLHQNNTLFNLLYRNERNFFGRIHSQYFIILQICATSS